MDTAAKSTILVVDDNADFRKALSVRLRANGYEVVTAGDALSATAAIVNKKTKPCDSRLGTPCGGGFVVME